MWWSAEGADFEEFPFSKLMRTLSWEFYVVTFLKPGVLLSSGRKMKL